jgi:quercetin dioxygenase-like cupin family protein
LTPGITAKLEHGAGRSFAVFESEHLPGSPGPPLHVHRAYDEAFYVVSGAMDFSVDGNTDNCPAGSFVWVPRGAAHRFRNTSDEPAKFLVIMTPEAILLIEEFVAMAGKGPPDPAAAQALFARYNSEILPPA